MPKLIEGHLRYCRHCGHNLIGLAGDRCPQCGRVAPALVARPPRSHNGQWLVAAMVLGAAILAAIALKYRHFEPPPSPTTTRTTLPTSGPGR